MRVLFSPPAAGIYDEGTRIDVEHRPTGYKKGKNELTDTLLLEKALSERIKDITDDTALTDALYRLLDAEPVADAELICESADMLASLAGETDEMTDESVDRVRFTLVQRIAADQIGEKNEPEKEMIARPKRGIKWKMIIPIAAVITLLAAFTVMAVTGSIRLADITNAFWKIIKPGEKIVESNYELEKGVDHRDYDEFDAMLESEGITGLLVPDGMKVSDPLVVEYGDYREITATFTDADGREYDYEAQYPSQTDKINAELTKIGVFDVSLSHYDDVYQAELIYDGVWYVIGTDDQEALSAFVETLGK